MAFEVVEVEFVLFVELHFGDQGGEVFACCAEAVDEDDGGAVGFPECFVVEWFVIDGSESL